MANKELNRIYSGPSYRDRYEDILYHRNERARKAKSARTKAMYRRMKDTAADCALNWVNETFGANLDCLPQGIPGNERSCPIANAIADHFGDLASNVIVDGKNVVISFANEDYTDEYTPPLCVAAFISNFDRGFYPNLIHPDYSL
jgi:hypothetical protein